jgi:acetyl esterase/lipase
MCRLFFFVPIHSIHPFIKTEIMVTFSYKPTLSKSRVVLSSFIIILLFSLGGCSKELSDSDNVNDFNPAVAKTMLNEAYGAGARQVADIYLPANRSTVTNVIIMLHGGSWAEGSKSDLTSVINTFRLQWPEAAVINMNYTLANNTTSTYHPAQMNDIKLLLDYIAVNRSKWKIGESTGLVGVSAGGHLALLYAYAYDNTKSIKAVGSIVGPTDFSDPLYTSNIIFQAVAANLLGKTWSQDPDLHRSVSPALRVTATSPPTFLAYGALDPVVPLSNATTLRNNLTANGVTHTYVEYATEGHEFTETTIQDVIPKVTTFLRTHL